MQQKEKGKMKTGILVLMAVLVSGCGYSSRGNEMSGQAKKVTNETPLVCGDRVDADISLGVMKNGVGSMSSQDLWVTVPNQSDQDLLKKAAAQGSLVKITYDVARWVWCWNDHIVSRVEIIQ